MPIIAQVMIPLQFKEDGVVEILKDEFQRFGCIDLAKEAETLNTSVDRLVRALRSIDGVVCNESNVCCVSDVQSFAEKLRRFREDS